MQWHHEEIERLTRKPIVPPAGGLPKAVFYGSSTFTYWPDMAEAFPQVQAVNLRFGGSTLAACAWFFKTVVPPHRPDLLLYAGDNDLGDGRTPEEVVLFYEQLLSSIAGSLGAIPVCFISIKPSPARQHLRGGIEYANRCISQRVAANGPRSTSSTSTRACSTGRASRSVPSSPPTACTSRPTATPCGSAKSVSSSIRCCPKHPQPTYNLNVILSAAEASRSPR
jgi:hypothetical protein